jgi:RimJ/RimL family protein N-acetyltransferase
VIAGGELTLRPWLPADTSFVFDSCQDPEVQRWTRMPTPYTALDAATFVERHARPQPEDDGAFFAITKTDTGEVLGSMSFGHIDWAFAVAEAGYWVTADARGQGVATRALEALVDWGRRELRLVEVRLQVLVGNVASQRVAERAGFEAAGPGHAEGDGLVAFVRRLAD